MSARRPTNSLRGRLTKQLVEHGYPGRVYPVTRSQKEVLGHQAYATVAEIPEAADLAVILVPAAHVVSTIEQCGARGIKAAVVISSGFGEEKSDEAAARDTALRDIAKRTGMVIAGPNSEGLVNPLRPLVATFSPVFHDHTVPLLPEGSRAKPIAVSCQSGALTYAFLSRGRDRQLQFTYQVSAGNQTVLEAHDYVDWVLDAGGADIFMCYLEGIRDPARFRAVADKAARAGKPMIVAKVGRSDAGRRAAASHTGALAHAGSADDAIFRHHGIIRGEDLDHMVDVATAFAYCPPPRGNRVAIITGSGGSAVWMADILSAHGLELPVLEDDIQRAADGDAAVLRLGAEPDRRDGAGDRRGRLRADGRAGAPVRADRHDPADQLAGQREPRQEDGRRAGADHRDARQADPDVDLHDRDPGGDRDLGRGRHPLLHLDAELRPRDPGAGRLRRVPRAAAPRRAAEPASAAGAPRRGRARAVAARARC